MQPLFTSANHIPVIKSFFEQFCMLDNIDPNTYKVYPLNQLFFVLKQEACKYGMDLDKGFDSIHVAQAILDRDQYDFREGLACAVS